jgi:molybdopterin molybdotransferase
VNGLLAVAEAEALIGQNLQPFASEVVPLDRVAGRILRQRVLAERDQPPFDRVMMDGIAIAQGAAAVLPRYRVAGVQLAGMATAQLGDHGDCLEVTTGAILPAGCDTVIPVEQLRREGDYFHLLDGYRPLAGQFVHARGSDCRKADELLAPGVRLGAPELAVLAANGVAQVDVATVPSIALISTGDELVDVDAPVADWQIRRSNDLALAAALRARGFEDQVFAHVRDDLAATTECLGQLLAQRQVLILTGGVSMGQRDYVPAALHALGVREVFHKIAQRPGKPMWFGIGREGQAVFALPGNPVSALACGLRYVLPGLLAAQGANVETAARVVLNAPIDASPSLTCFVPVQVYHDETGRALAQPVPSKTSGDFSSLTRTHGFVQLPPGPGRFEAGYVAAFYRW